MIFFSQSMCCFRINVSQNSKDTITRRSQPQHLSAILWQLPAAKSRESDTSLVSGVPITRILFRRFSMNGKLTNDDNLSGFFFSIHLITNNARFGLCWIHHPNFEVETFPWIHGRVFQYKVALITQKWWGSYNLTSDIRTAPPPSVWVGPCKSYPPLPSVHMQHHLLG